MEELDTEPAFEELRKAIDSLASGKALGGHCPPPPSRPNQALQDHLTPFYACSPLLVLARGSCTIRHEGPQNHHTLQKQGKERSDCNNYRGISLLSIIGKVFAKVILIRLQKLAERVYPESRCGFRAERSTIDMVFSLCQLQEKCREQQMRLYIAFIDLTPSRSYRLWTFFSGLQGFRTNQSEEDQRPGVGYSETASHLHRWLSSMSLNSSHILAPPSLTTCPWTPRSIIRIGKWPTTLARLTSRARPTPDWQ